MAPTQTAPEALEITDATVAYAIILPNERDRADERGDARLQTTDRKSQTAIHGGTIDNSGASPFLSFLLLSFEIADVGG